jgi:predicted DNA-binding protein (MmcQ/YjbR family)
MTTDADLFLADLKALCARLPEAELYTMVHHPAFRVGKKPFAICGMERGTTLSINFGVHDQGLLLDDARFSRTHYIGQHGWVTIHATDLAGPDELEALVTRSYTRIAPKRALKALEAART